MTSWIPPDFWSLLLMKRLYQYFFRGLITALPLGLTVYFLYLFLTWVEEIAMWWIRPFIGKFYVPGLDLVLGIGGIILLGFLISHQHARKLLSLVELPFTNLPVIKSIYSSLKNFADYFAPYKESASQQVVTLKIPGNNIEMVGLITRQSVDGLPEGFMQGDRVAVFLPMGYNIGGYTVFVPRDWLKPVNMSVEEAMTSSLFAWMENHDNAKSQAPSASNPPS
jgi:uncharacterized membrane protein